MQSDVRLGIPNMIEAEKQRGQDFWSFPKRSLMYSGVQLLRKIDTYVKNLYCTLLDTACKYNCLRKDQVQNLLSRQELLYRTLCNHEREEEAEIGKHRRTAIHS